MEILLALSISYLILTLAVSSDKFIVESVAFIALGSIYIICLTIDNFYLFFIASIILISVISAFQKIALCDVIKIMFICTISVFWLSTSEFMDGYLYSYIFVAIGTAIVSNLIFPVQNRQISALVSTIFPYWIAYMFGVNIILENLLMSMIIAWIFTSITAFQSQSYRKCLINE